MMLESNHGQLAADAASAGLDPYIPRLKEVLRRVEELDLAALNSPQSDKQLHRTLAEWYETVYAEDDSEVLTLLAHHWETAGDAAKSRHYLVKAAEHELRRDAFSEAIGYLERATGMAGVAGAHGADGSSGPELSGTQLPCETGRARAERLLGEAYMCMGSLADSHEHLLTAVRLLGSPLPSTRAGLVIGSVKTHLSNVLGKHRRPAVAAPGSLEAIKHREAAKAWALLQERFHHANDTVGLVYSSLRGLVHSELLGPSPELANAYANMSVMSGLVRRHSTAQEYAARARAVPGADDAGYRSCAYLAGAAKWDELDQILPSAIEKLTAVGDWRGLGDCLHISAEAHIARGRLDQAMESWKRLGDTAWKHSGRQQQVWASQGTARCLLRLGRLEEAMRECAHATGLLKGTGDKTAAIATYGVEAAARWRLGQSAAAEELAERTAAMISRLPSHVSLYALAGYDAVAEVYLGLLSNADAWTKGVTGGLEVDGLEVLALSGRRPGLVKIAAEACRRLERASKTFPVGRPSALLRKGTLLWLTDKTSSAGHAWRKGAALAAELGTPLEEALCLERLDSARRQSALRQ